MKKGLITLLCLAPLLVSCASETYYQAALSSWHGATQATVYRIWGYPDQVETLPNGHPVLIYRTHIVGQTPVYSTPSITTVNTDNNNVTVINSSGMIAGGDIYDYQCTTFFELDNKGIVLNTNFRGNNCVATKDFMLEHTYTG